MTTTATRPLLEVLAEHVTEVQARRANPGIICVLCRELGLGHDGDHIVPAPVAEDVEHYDTLHDVTEAEHRMLMGWDAVEEGAAFDRDNPNPRD